jgi:hypothetical protein
LLQILWAFVFFVFWAGFIARREWEEEEEEVGVVCIFSSAFLPSVWFSETLQYEGKKVLGVLCLLGCRFLLLFFFFFFRRRLLPPDRQTDRREEEVVVVA